MAHHRLSVLVLALSLLIAAPALAKNGGNGTNNVNDALVAMAAGAATIGGPGYYDATKNGNRDVFRTTDLSPAARPDVCITMRNLGPNGRVKIVADGMADEEIRPGITVTRCYEAPEILRLRCGGDDNARGCKAVWRVDQM